MKQKEKILMTKKIKFPQQKKIFKNQNMKKI